MINRKKRFGLIGLFFLIVAICAAIGMKYFPFSRILNKKAGTETEFVNRQSIRSQAPNALYFDFEVAASTGERSGFYKGIAHSGQYSTKAFGKNSFSFSVERKAGDIGLSNLKAVALSAWVYIFPTQHDILASFVFTISNTLGVNTCWKGIMVGGEKVPMGKWFKISGFFDISDVKIKPDDKIQVYFWNNSSVDLLADDYYMVFGGPRERKGDSVLVDMTKHTGFPPKINWPPFPDVYMDKEEIGNGNSGFLVNNGKEKAGDISATDRLFTGHFIANNAGTDDLLAVGTDGKTELFSYCNSGKSFKMITITNAQELKNMFASPMILTGYFTGQPVTEILMIGKEKVITGRFDHLKDPCTSSALKVTFKIISDQGKENPGRFSSEGATLVAGDFNGDERSELLVLTGNGSWKLFSFSNTGPNQGIWQQVADSKDNPIASWDRKNIDFNVTCGKFLPGINADVILTAGIDKNKPVYTIYRYNQDSKQFIPWFKTAKDFYGRIIGPDSIKPADHFFDGKFLLNQGSEVLRYNRDWRFDLKQIRFSDTTFRILANVDFRGYDNDHNPKYYEMLRIIPGNFTNAGKTSLMIIGRNKNKSTSRILPDVIQVYSFQH